MMKGGKHINKIQYINSTKELYFTRTWRRRKTDRVISRGHIKKNVLVIMC